ncbi:hypothetical protein BD324DRAFT_636039 [Kockovaella imperatae]|uniref:Secreted protein n=1 Tax=Kockovaella imperatae TaxID=4999 RepID=A0A1Y1UAE5_9TREE|nr:hypothetical protein BD324DRAFT_636039 [Kockovaella imperatae]ORX34466.1 hypothetical protein BD324DRAFT_636039 [Kockovaella imperatae]
MSKLTLPVCLFVVIGLIVNHDAPLSSISDGSSCKTDLGRRRSRGKEGMVTNRIAETGDGLFRFVHCVTVLITSLWVVAERGLGGSCTRLDAQVVSGTLTRSMGNKSRGVPRNIHSSWTTTLGLGVGSKECPIADSSSSQGLIGSELQ